MALGISYETSWNYSSVNHVPLAQAIGCETLGRLLGASFNSSLMANTLFQFVRDHIPLNWFIGLMYCAQLRIRLFLYLTNHIEIYFLNTPLRFSLGFLLPFLHKTGIEGIFAHANISFLLTLDHIL